MNTTAPYLVTTRVDRLPRDRPIIMVDGTVPGWQPKPGDRHWDHHRPNGADIQIDEIPLPQSDSLLAEQVGLQQTELGIELLPCFVTTMVDADACCAAAWIQLPRAVLTVETIARLRAIAWDCDHLMVPADLNSYSEFAAKAGAALKASSEGIAAELGLPHERKQWTDEHWEAYSSLAFQRGSEWLIAAAKGERPYPGAQGEADDYWQQIEADTQMLLRENRIQFVQTDRGAIAICDVRSLNHSVDPRSFYEALRSAPSPLRPETLMIRDHRLGGTQYTLGSLPLHPDTPKLDFTQSTFEHLTQAERAKNPLSDAWGGRRTVGGSAWNTPSGLTVADIIAVLH
jgi:hypothetical protein